MSVKILTDSTSDILPQESARLGVDIVPLRVFFGDESFRDAVDITHEEFFARLPQSRQLPTTSQPTPEDFLPFFEKAKENGDSVVCVLLAAGLSGTTQSAAIAKDLCGYDNIYVVDSTQTTIGLRVLVDLARVLRDQGLSGAEIAAQLEQAKGRLRLFAMVDTLEYLRKGGRLSPAVAVAGSLLRVKPLISLKDGELTVVGKGVGLKDALTKLIELAGDFAMDERVPLYYGYTANSTQCDKLIELADPIFQAKQTRTCSVGAVIGAHAGPGAVVYAYLAAE